MGNAIGRVTSILCIPYGYTVTLWCAGALAVARLGFPGPLDVVLFAAGATAAFLGLALVGHPHLDAELPMRVPSVVVMNALPTVAALVLVVLPNGVLGRRRAFFASGLVATAIYVVGLALVIHVARPGADPGGLPRTGAKGTPPA